MILEVFEHDTGLRLGLIKTYDFIEYNEKFNGIGDFTMNIPFTEKALDILSKNNYVLFEKEDMGVIKYRYKSVDDEAIIIIKGYMLNKILEYRVFDKTFSKQGTIRTIAETIVTKYFITPDNQRRKVDIIKISEDNSKKDFDETTLIFQRTGAKISDGISELLATKSYGYKMVPKVVNYDEMSAKPTNIKSIDFELLKPTDRTQGNIYGNPPITFSLELKNLQKLEYLEDSTDYNSTAIVAGEGEGTDRYVIETGDLEVSGLNRIELYVDARDLQREDIETGKVMTIEEYKKALDLRGLEYLEDHKSFISFSGQIIDSHLTFYYNDDFKLGDYVSIVDKQLNISVAAQITAVKHSATQTGDKIDITFGYQKDSIKQLLKKRSVI